VKKYGGASVIVEIKLESMKEISRQKSLVVVSR
jgi:hypothetical protein